MADKFAPRSRSRRRDKQAPRHNRERPAADAVAQVLNERGLARAVRGNHIAIEWAALVGARVAAHCVPQGIRRNVLEVAVSNSTWLHELTLMKAQLLPKLIEAVGQPPLFDDLRFVLARGALERATPTTVRTPATPPRHQPPGLTSPTPAYVIIDDVEQVDDPELRAMIGAVRLRHSR